MLDSAVNADLKLHVAATDGTLYVVVEKRSLLGLGKSVGWED